MKALLVVDVQNDFVSGSLAVPDAEAVVTEVERLASEAELVVATRDWHPADHFSFSDEPEFRDGSWPAHSVQFTDGAQLAFGVAHGTVVVSKGEDRDTEAYSGFDGTVGATDVDLADYLRARDVNEVEVVGLALDYCVRATALDAQREGFKTTVLLDGTRAVAQETGDQALADLREAGVEVR